MGRIAVIIQWMGRFLGSENPGWQPPQLPADEKERDDPDLLSPEGPLGPTGGQVGNPQRF